jgi:hypothetical protein
LRIIALAISMSVAHVIVDDDARLDMVTRAPSATQGE